MRRIVFCVLLVLLALVPLGRTSPVDRTFGGRVEIAPSGPWVQKRNFLGGERACVLAIGDQTIEIKEGEHVKAPIVNLHVSIFDGKGTLIVEDKGNSDLTGDVVGVVWYPPRTGEYRVEVRNPGLARKVYVAIK
jgi:hypothetical protein